MSSSISSRYAITGKKHGSGDGSYSTNKIKRKQRSALFARLRLWISRVFDILASPYRWLFRHELFGKTFANDTSKASTSSYKVPHFSSSLTRSLNHAGIIQRDFVEKSPSWSQGELFGTTTPQSKISYKLSAILAASNEPSPGYYCLRNRSLTVSDIPQLPLSSFSRKAASLSHINLVLDLDETLVYSSSESSDSCDLIAEVAQPECIRAPPLLYYVHKRPYLDRFLRIVSEWFRLSVYTASRAEYAMIVCDWLDPKGNLFGPRRLFRESCVERDGILMKDLRLIEPDMSRVCLIDNSPCSFLLCPDNAIPITGWSAAGTGGCSDRSLLQLLPLLDALRFASDVRSILSLRRVT